MSSRRLLDSIDPATVLAVLGLAVIGILAIASATLDRAGLDGLWRTQLLWVSLAMTAAVVIVLVDYHVWSSIAILLHAVAVCLLIAVLFFGYEVGGNKSWLVVGPMRLQPSELAKWTTCLSVAAYLARQGVSGVGIRQMFEIGLLVGGPMVLIAMQPDFGTAITFVPIYVAAVWIGGIRWKIIGAIALVGILSAPVGWTQLEPYQQERILTVLDAERDPTGVGYQVRQSKIAIGSGGLTGKGLFRGTQSQLDYLPAQHTDFILSVIAEELGFAGALGVLGLLYLLLHRGLSAAANAQDRLGSYICLLVVAWISGQAMINIGMVLGLLPTIGVPLPLLSYGGSALLASMSGIALVANVQARRFVN